VRQPDRPPPAPRIFPGGGKHEVPRFAPCCVPTPWRARTHIAELVDRQLAGHRAMRAGINKTEARAAGLRESPPEIARFLAAAEGMLTLAFHRAASRRPDARTACIEGPTPIAVMAFRNSSSATREQHAAAPLAIPLDREWRPRWSCCRLAANCPPDASYTLATTLTVAAQLS
jgi:hypothetical protein